MARLTDVELCPPSPTSAREQKKGSGICRDIVGCAPASSPNDRRCATACWCGLHGDRPTKLWIKTFDPSNGLQTSVSPVEHGDSLPEHGRRRAFPRLPLIDDGLPRRAHQRSQLRLAQAARATQRANLHIVVAWHAGPGQWRATIIWADHPPIVRPPGKNSAVAGLTTAL